MFSPTTCLDDATAAGLAEATTDPREPQLTCLIATRVGNDLLKFLRRLGGEVASTPLLIAEFKQWFSVWIEGRFANLISRGC